MSNRVQWLTPEWPVDPRVRVISTLRGGGVSSGPYASLNLAAHTGDDPARVAENRRRLRQAAGLPAEPLWMEQVHGCGVVACGPSQGTPRADAAHTATPGCVCAVMTADCLPVVLADREGNRVGIAHAGWRGLAGGVVEATVAALGVDPARLAAWLGPAIGPAAFEVGAEVRDAFMKCGPGAAAAFAANPRGRFQADLYGLARWLLARAGVADVYGGEWCTHSDDERFFSFRRDGATGRMATLAWLDGPAW
jgi:YfiH family protein